MQKGRYMVKDEWLGPGVKIVPKNWGEEQWLHNSEKYCGKILCFNKGKRCSFHLHLVKEEHFWLSVGKILLKYSFEDDLDKANEIILNPGDNFHIPVGLRHQMIALEDSKLVEFSSTHADEDSIRIVKGD